MRAQPARRPAIHLDDPAGSPDHAAQARCGSCEIELAPPAVRQRTGAFCCAGCAAGGPCVCSYDREDDDD